MFRDSQGSTQCLLWRHESLAEQFAGPAGLTLHAHLLETFLSFKSNVKQIIKCFLALLLLSCALAFNAVMEEHCSGGYAAAD